MTKDKEFREMKETIKRITKIYDQTTAICLITMGIMLGVAIWLIISISGLLR